MKGVSIIAVVGVVAAVTLIAAGLISNTMYSIQANYVQILKDRLLISALNQLNLAKISAVHAMRYSLFQATYEKAKIGFCEKELCYDGYWRNYTETEKAPKRENVTYLIGNETLIKFNGYADRLSGSFTSISGLKLRIPSLSPYTNEFNLSGNDFIEINVSTPQKITIYLEPIGERSSLQLNFNFLIKDFIPIFKMFSFGKRIFVEEDLIAEAIDYSIENLSDECKEKSQKFCENETHSCPICEFLEIDKEYCKREFEEKFHEFMDDELKDEREMAEEFDVEINYEIEKFYFLIEGTCRNLGCEEDHDCGCEKEECECICLEYDRPACECIEWNLEDCTCHTYNTTICDCVGYNLPECEDSCQEWVIENCTCKCVKYANPNCECLQWEKIHNCNCTKSQKVCECIEYYESNVMECVYEWKVAADILINISTNYTKYPVYDDKTTKFRNLQLLFKVKSGYYEAEENYLMKKEEVIKNLIC